MIGVAVMVGHRRGSGGGHGHSRAPIIVQPQVVPFPIPMGPAYVEPAEAAVNMEALAEAVADALERRRRTGGARNKATGPDVLGDATELYSRDARYVFAWETAEPDFRDVAESYKTLLPESITEARIQHFWDELLKLNDALHAKYGLAAYAGQISFTTLDAAVQRLKGEFGSAILLADAKLRRAVRFLVADRLSYVLSRAHDAYKAKFGSVGDLSAAVATLSTGFGRTIGKVAGGLTAGALQGAGEEVAKVVPWWAWLLGGVAAIGAAYAAFRLLRAAAPAASQAVVARYLPPLGSRG